MRFKLSEVASRACRPQMRPLGSMVERPPPTNGQAEGCGFESHDGRFLLRFREKRPILPDVFLVAPTYLIKFLASL